MGSTSSIAASVTGSGHSIPSRASMLLIGGGLAHPTSSRESRVSAQFTPVVEGRVLVGFAVPAKRMSKM
jgi:hypothetical protein